MHDLRSLLRAGSVPQVTLYLDWCLMEQEVEIPSGLISFFLLFGILCAISCLDIGGDVDRCTGSTFRSQRQRFAVGSRLRQF